MSPTVQIPHQYIELDGGEDGTLRATLTTLPDGTASGHLSLATRETSRRYRAISGTLHQDAEGRGFSASIQLESLAASAGVAELAELSLNCRPDAPAAEAELSLRAIPDGTLVARCNVRADLV